MGKGVEKAKNTCLYFLFSIHAVRDKKIDLYIGLNIAKIMNICKVVQS